MGGNLSVTLFLVVLIFCRSFDMSDVQKNRGK